VSLIYSMLMSLDDYVEDKPNVPQFFDEWKLVSVRSPQLLQKTISPRLSIFSVRNDYRMSESKG